MDRVAQREAGRIDILKYLQERSGSTFLPSVLALSSACTIGEMISCQVSLSRQTQQFYRCPPNPKS